MKETLKSKKGITLIALVITIIILIILAGISISILTGQDGLITKARQAAQNYQNAATEEQTALNTLYGDLATGTIGTGSYDAVASLIQFRRQIAQAITNAGVPTNENDSLETMVNNIGKIRDDVTIILCANNGTSDMKCLRTIKNQPVTLEQNTYTKTGANVEYRFAGWNTEQDGSGTSYADQATITPNESNITLYAQWEQTKLWLYNNGDVCSNVTGGWSADDYHAQTSGQYYSTGAGTNSNGVITVTTSSPTSYCTLGTVNKINTTGFTKLKGTITSYSGSALGTGLSTSTEKMDIIKAHIKLVL